MIERYPSEPEDIKKAIKSLMEKMSNESWDWRSLAVWYRNRLPKYLWTEQDWKRDLSKRGWTWQSFLSLLSKHTHEIIRWANNEISWRELIKIIETDLKSPIISKIYKLVDFL